MADVAPDLAADLLAAFSAVPEDKVEALPAVRQPEVKEPPSSPSKRQRTTEPEDEGGADKRQKIEHGSPGNVLDQALGSASWDISALIQDALGSLDQQLDHQPANVTDHGAIQDYTTQTNHAVPATTKKVEQKRMKFSSNPFYVTRTMSLPLLGSLAVQILLALSQQPRQETLALIADHESEYRKAYDLLKSALEQARRMFSESTPLLFADDLEISDSEDRETLRMSNLAAISSSVLQGDDALLPECHENFAAVFIPEDGELAENTTDLCINLKTQIFLRSLREIDNSQGRSDALDTHFPANVDELVSRHIGDTPSRELARERLASGIRTRRQELLESILDDHKRAQLPEQYSFDGFADELSIYLQGHLGTTIEYAEKYGINIPISEDITVNEPLHNGEPDTDHDELSLLLQNATSSLIPNGTESSANVDHGASLNEDSTSLADSLGLGKLIQESLSGQGSSAKELPDTAATNGGDPSDPSGLTSLIASKLHAGFGGGLDGSQNFPSPQSYHPPLHHNSNTAGQPTSLAQLNHVSQTPYYSYNHQPPPPPQPAADGGSLPPNQSFPTSILYERARQAAVAKSSSTARREGLHSTRRAWTPEEEKALMAGLDMVKGPHWSQILTLFGPNGTISDILKDRTQVQLKDKARNLKLFFLKTNSEMPYYLQCVTGELKTRAPSQAARKEAEEKARLNSEEEQARLQGVATHAPGLHNNNRNTSSPVPISASTSTRASPVTAGVGVAVPGYGGPAASPVRNTPVATAAPPATPTAIAAAAAITSPHVKSEPAELLSIFQTQGERSELSALQQALHQLQPVQQSVQPVQHPVQPVQQQVQSAQQPLQQQPVLQPKIEVPGQPAAHPVEFERPRQPETHTSDLHPTGQTGVQGVRVEAQVPPADQQPQSQPAAQAQLQQTLQPQPQAQQPPAPAPPTTNGSRTQPSPSPAPAPPNPARANQQITLP